MGQVTIQDVCVRAVRIPMQEPHQTATGSITESPLVLTDIRTDGGVVGHSYVFAYTSIALKPLANLIANLQPLIQGDALTPLTIERKLAQRFRLLGSQGLAGMAMAAIDMAVWDALARVQETSLMNLLGAAERPLRAYGAVGFDGIEGSAQIAARWAERGFSAVKAKIGYRTLEEDIAVIRAMRDAVGANVAIMVDYNQSLSVAEAINRVRHLDDEGITWIEEPVLAHDFHGMAEVASAARTPIQAGENWWGPLDTRHAIAVHATDLLMPDVMKAGGVTGWMRTAALAEAHGLSVSNHLFPEISAQLMCATPTAHLLEYADWWNPVIERPLEIRGGVAVIPHDVKGSGVSWNEEAITRYSA